MSYEKIIAARQKLQALGVRHFATGGVNDIPVFNPVPSWLGVKNPSAPGLPNPVNAVTPQNSFQATVPGITQTDFQPAMADGRADAARGQRAMDQAAIRLDDLGKSQLATTGGIGTEAGAVSGLAGDQGLGGVLGQQQTLGQALLDQSKGQGPNPALDQYRQNVNQAIAQNSGMIASQKGLNPALAARMASENAASMTQGAASNAAQLQAEQQLAAEGQLGSVLAQQGNTVMGQGQLHSTAGNLIGTQVGAMGQAGQSFQGQGSLGNSMSGQGNQLYGTAVSGQGNQNNATNTGSLGAQGINAGVANTNTLARQGVTGGLLNAGGGLLGGMINSGNSGNGGGTQSYAQGGEVQDESTTVLARILANADRPPEMAGRDGAGGGGSMPGMGLLGNAAGGWLGGVLGGGGGGSLASADSLMGSSAADEAGMAGALGDAGTVMAARGGEIPDRKALSLARALMAQGGPVPGKANVRGNSLKNDVVPAVLSPGEVVLPRSVTQSPDAPEKAARFLAAIKERDQSAKEPASYGHVLTKVRAIRTHLAELEKHLGRAS